MRSIRVCRGPHCRFRGAERIMEVLKKYFGAQTDAVDLNYCNCTDNCDFGPVVVENDALIYRKSETHDIAERLETGNGEPCTPADLSQINLDSDTLS